MPFETLRLPHVLRGNLQGITTGLRAGKGEAVILIHGVGMGAAVWGQQIELLAARYDVIAYDMLGHGGSSLPPPDPTLADYADQLLAVMRTLGLAQAHVVGHSMGALVAVEFALAHPDRVRSVVALNAVHGRSQEQRMAVQMRAARLSEGNDPKAVDGTIARWFGDPVAAQWQEAAALARQLLTTVDPTGYRRAYTLFANADAAHRGRLQTLRMRALFMTGELDPNSTPEMSRAMAAAAPDGRAEIVPAERHMMALTAPREIGSRLMAFLDGASAPAIDSKALRAAFGAFATGVTVVATTERDGSPRGFTANSFTSVSLDPPLVLVCIAKTASSYAVFSGTTGFAISILAESQRDVSGLFASKAADKFERAAWRRSGSGHPIIEEAAAWLDCRTERIVEAGDHAILIGRVLQFGDSTVNPLGYCRGAYVTFSLSQAALGAPARPRVGAILESAGRILFLSDGQGSIELPEGLSLEPDSDPNSLNGLLRRRGLATQLGFLFAVFEDPRRGAGAVSVYYRGSVETPLPEVPGLQLIPFAEIPWSEIQDDAIRAMLIRYVRERSEDTFGIYVGDAERGTVRTLVRSADPV
jgi:flavin reductase (DIM6/NTAB) family NADH-FMN oxidoreductase RutF/pimeloyl-ACP methyl ester carboxylesterase